MLVSVDVYLTGLSDIFFFFKQKTAYEMRISDWSSDVCSSDLQAHAQAGDAKRRQMRGIRAEYLHVAGTRRRQPHDAAQRSGFARAIAAQQIGRASCRERGCQYV